MFGISGFELLIILAFVLIIFGPDKLPQLAKTIASGMRMFKSAQEDMERVIKAEMITGEMPKFDLGTLTGSSSTKAEGEPETAKSPAVASSDAASVWTATSEDDEEEDEE